MQIHNVKARVFALPGGEGICERALRECLGNPEELEVQKTKLKGYELEGYEGFDHPIVVLRARLTKAEEIRNFFQNLREKLKEEDWELIEEEMEERIDEACNFYLRLSKKAAYSDQLELHEEDPVHLRLKIAAYPAKKENAIEVMKEVLEKEKNKK